MKKLTIFFAHALLVAASLFADNVDVRNVGKEDIRISMGRDKQNVSAKEYSQQANDNGWLGVPSETLDAKLNVDFGSYTKPSFIFVSEGEIPAPLDPKKSWVDRGVQKIGAQHKQEAFAFGLAPLNLKTLTGIVYFHDKDNKRRMVVEGIEDRYTKNKVAVVIDGEELKK